MASAEPTKLVVPTASVNTVAKIFTMFFMIFLFEYERLNNRRAAGILYDPTSHDTYVV